MPNYVDNTKARFNYEILEEYEAGIELLGFEVKSIREKHGRLEGAHVIVRGGEAFVVGMDLPPFQPKNTPENYSPTRTRKLLLKKSEVSELADKEGTKGLTLIPLSLYSKGTKLKIKIAVVRGKKKFDKRDTIKKRDTDRDIRRTLKVR
jgi:SsrA-binding protein